MELRSVRYTSRRRWRVPLWALALLVLACVSLWNRRELLVERATFVLPDPTPTPSAVNPLAQARVHEAQGDLLKAAEFYGQVAAIETWNPQPLVDQSRLYILLKQIPKALAAAEEAVRRDDRHVDSLNALARALDWSGEYEEAVNTAVDALVLSPDNSRTLAILGEIYADVGNWYKAEDYLDQAAELAPLDVLVWRNKALLHEYRGEYTEGLAALEQGLSVDPSAWYLEIHKGRLYEALFEWENALEAYERALELNPNVSLTWDALGYGHFKVGNDLEARRNLERAVEVNSRDGLAMAHLGTVYYRMRNYEGAVDILSEALDLIEGTPRIEFLYQLGLAYVYKDPSECDKAKPWLLAALEIDPESGPALEGLESCPV